MVVMQASGENPPAAKGGSLPAGGAVEAGESPFFPLRSALSDVTVVSKLTVATAEA